MAENKAVIPFGAFKDLGTSDERWEKSYIDNIKTNSIAVNNAMKFTIIGGKLCVTYSEED